MSGWQDSRSDTQVYRGGWSRRAGHRSLGEDRLRGYKREHCDKWLRKVARFLWHTDTEMQKDKEGPQRPARAPSLSGSPCPLMSPQAAPGTSPSASCRDRALGSRVFSWGNRPRYFAGIYVHIHCQGPRTCCPFLSQKRQTLLLTPFIVSTES